MSKSKNRFERILQPHELPVIDIKKVETAEGFKLNPWFYKGKKYRIVGFTDEEFNKETGKWEKVGKHHLKCVTTGTYKYPTTQQLRDLIKSA